MPTGHTSRSSTIGLDVDCGREGGKEVESDGQRGARRVHIQHLQLDFNSNYQRRPSQYSSDSIDCSSKGAINSGLINLLSSVVRNTILQAATEYCG